MKLIKLLFTLFFIYLLSNIVLCREINEKQKPGLLGIALDSRTINGKNYVLARSVLPTLAAHKAGIKSEDIILKYNDKTLSDPDQLKTLAKATKPGTKVFLTILRQEEEIKIEVVMGSEDDFKKMTQDLPGKEAPELLATNIFTKKEEKIIGNNSKLTLLKFWATWCPACRSSITKIQKLHNTYSKKGLRIIALSTEESEVVLKFLEERNEKPSYEFYTQKEEKLAPAYWANAIPLFILVDNNSKVLHVQTGSNLSKIKEIIENSL